MKRLYGDASSHLIIEVSPAIKGVEINEFSKHKRDFPSQGFFLVTKDKRVLPTSFYANHQEGIRRVLFVAWVGEYPSGDVAEQIIETVFRLCPKYDEDADPVIWEPKITALPDLPESPEFSVSSVPCTGIDLGASPGSYAATEAILASREIIRTPTIPKIAVYSKVTMPEKLHSSSEAGAPANRYVEEAIWKAKDEILKRLKDSKELWHVEIDRGKYEDPHDLRVVVTFDPNKVRLLYLK